MAQQWWRNAVVYQVYPRSFADNDGDGIGDLPGITSRLDHIAGLGVDAIWLSPFFRSPQRDGGYDVSDYCDVDPLFGTLHDFDALAARAHELGLRVIVDLVPNHTSSDHAWFQAALASPPGSPERARYLFRPPTPEPPNNWLSAFGGPAWAISPDDPYGEWYFRLFDASQPDLDWRNPEVADMFEGVLRFWLERGVDGFRVDVAHGLAKADGMPDQVMSDGGPLTSEPSEMVERGITWAPMWDQPAVHEIYHRWRAVLGEFTEATGAERMMVAEAMPLSAEAMALYVRPDEFQQAFNFAFQWANWSAEEYRTVITATMTALAEIGSPPTWVLDSHDKPRHVTRYGGGPVGLARARAATLLMLALPGSAYLYQGEELGLPEVDVAPEFRQDPKSDGPTRDGCRVPIPWHGDIAPYGFGPPNSVPWLPQPDAWSDLSVAVQAGVADSTLEFYRSALQTRRALWFHGPDQIDLVTAGADLVALRRGGITVVLNAGTEAVALPEGEVLISSGPGAVQGRGVAGAPAMLAPDACVWIR